MAHISADLAGPVPRRTSFIVVEMTWIAAPRAFADRAGRVIVHHVHLLKRFGLVRVTCHLSRLEFDGLISVNGLGHRINAQVLLLQKLFAQVVRGHLDDFVDYAYVSCFLLGIPEVTLRSQVHSAQHKLVQ
uniref:(northern house mosquito) hypothetical protein n=1 Tax=Culex pipiens TaxID=7175 RepID=A0A8D8B186_CULPI